MKARDPRSVTLIVVSTSMALSRSSRSSVNDALTAVVMAASLVFSLTLPAASAVLSAAFGDAFFRLAQALLDRFLALPRRRGGA